MLILSKHFPNKERKKERKKEKETEDRVEMGQFGSKLQNLEILDKLLIRRWACIRKKVRMRSIHSGTWQHIVTHSSNDFRK